MMVIAVLVLPALGLTLLLMDRVENWMSGPSTAPRHAGGRRHLRLLPGGGQSASRAAHASGARHRDAA
ncbi:hypothetical protein ACF081_17825 [Streptomyces longwoodensis]|uniref:hypothetical protein n=1 Tax=Streptomyces longwoodensis TaxID=68231 RepID=UPI003702072D